MKDAAGKPFNTIRYDYRELLPLLRHRWEPDNPAVKRIRDRERNVHLSISRRAAGEGGADSAKRALRSSIWIAARLW